MTNKRILLTWLLMNCLAFCYGQSDKKIVADAWVYLDNWTTYTNSDTLSLVKSWNEPRICFVSFENGTYTVTDEQVNMKERGTWQMKKQGARTLIIVKLDNGHTIRFEVLSVNNSSLRLKRVT